MKARPQRLDRVKFRELDARAGEAVREMLSLLPFERSGEPPPEVAEGAPVVAPGALNRDRVLAQLTRWTAQPLASPLAHYALERDGGALRLVRSELEERSVGTPHGWRTLPLASVRRVAPDSYVVYETKSKESAPR